MPSTVRQAAEARRGSAWPGYGESAPTSVAPFAETCAVAGDAAGRNHGRCHLCALAQCCPLHASLASAAAFGRSPTMWRETAFMHRILAAVSIVLAYTAVASAQQIQPSSTAAQPPQVAP